MRRPFAKPTTTEHAQAADDPSVSARDSDPESGSRALPQLPLCFTLSHVERDGPVRLDGVKLNVTELMGIELDTGKLDAFAGMLNACDFPLQLLVRQHPPNLRRVRVNWNRPSPVTFRTRRKRQHARSAGCSPSSSRAKAFSTAASMRSASRSMRRSCAACSRVRVFPPIQPQATRSSTWSLPPPWAGRRLDPTSTRKSRCRSTNATSNLARGWPGRCTWPSGRARSRPDSSSN